MFISMSVGHPYKEKYFFNNLIRDESYFFFKYSIIGKCQPKTVVDSRAHRT
jgi:hypothetical protein